MLKQKVFFFVPKEESRDMTQADELKQMADQYVRIYGEGCLDDPETPSFVRQMQGRRAEAELPRAG